MCSVVARRGDGIMAMVLLGRAPLAESLVA